MKRVLVTGGSGQVGGALLRRRWPGGWTVEAPTRAELDLGDPARLARTAATGGWAAVINAGAYTQVDRAETDTVAAWTINARAPEALARGCRDAGIPLVQVSTDYVFPGDGDRAWKVDDAPGPLGTYGASKLAGEIAIRSTGGRHAIVRTAWVISAGGSNFVRTMLRLAAERDVVRVVDDQHGSPTHAGDLADALATIAMRLADDPGAPTGIFHFANSGRVSWHGVARAIFDLAEARGMKVPRAEPIASSDYPTPARRPRNSLLACDAVTQAFGIAPRPWIDALEDIMAELVPPASAPGASA